MTTIAYKQGVIAGDTGVSIGNTFIGELTKIYKVEFENGQILAGIAGDPDKAVKFIQWLNDLGESFINSSISGIPKNDLHYDRLQEYGKNDEPFEAFIVVRHTASPEKIFTYEGSGIAVPIMCRFYACGSGRELALGAMEMDANAEKSVRVASKYDLHTKEPIQCLKFIG